MPHRRGGFWEHTVGPKSSLVAGAIALQADFAAEDGRLDEALELHTEAYELSKAALGESHGDTLLSLGKLSTVHRHKGNWARALELQRVHLRLGEPVLGERNPSLAYPLTSTGECLIELRRPKEALEPLERALAIRLGSDVAPELVGQTRYQLARALQTDPRERARARELATSAIADFEAAEQDHSAQIALARGIARP